MELGEVLEEFIVWSIDKPHDAYGIALYVPKDKRMTCVWAKLIAENVEFDDDWEGVPNELLEVWEA